MNGSFELSIPRSERGVSESLTERCAVGWRVGSVSLAVIVGAAFALRVAVRLWSGEATYEQSSYSFYLDIAKTWLDGDGLCWGAGVACALRMPVYPLWLAPFIAVGWVYPGVILAQAAVGAGTAWLTWAIGKRLFDRRVALLAAALTAANPYVIVHDTALQDTCLLNALVALAVFLILRLRDEASDGLAVGTGLALSLAVLTTARIALFVPAAIGWIALAGGTEPKLRLRHATIAAAMVSVLVGGWVVRNAFIIGAPVLTTETGLSLWVANNDWTFAHFPERSIDLSTVESYRHLSDQQRRDLSSVGDDQILRGRLQSSWALAWALDEPHRAARLMVRKLWVVASAQLSPARSPLVQRAYWWLFLPVHMLAMAGIWRSREDWRLHSLLYLLFGTFAITTAIFWAHTSHKSYLDAILFIYAAGGFHSILRREPLRE